MSSRVFLPSRTAGLLALLALTLAATTLLSLAWAPPASADVSCTGNIGAQTVDDNLRVPDGASCTLDGTVVQGNVLVGSGASLTARDVTVDGNVQDDDAGAGAVTVTGGRVGGNIQLERGAAVTVEGTAVDGDVQLEANAGAQRVESADIGGNLQANANTGGLAVVGNTIDGNLQCAGNDPAPTGSGNVVGGSAEGQCAALEGDGGSTPPPDSPPATPPGAVRETARLAGADRFATSVAIARAAFPDGAPVVYLARADDFADALAGGSLRDGPLLLVPGCGDVPPTVLEEVRRLDPQRIVALGGPAAVCDAVLDATAAA